MTDFYLCLPVIDYGYKHFVACPCKHIFDIMSAFKSVLCILSTEIPQLIIYAMSKMLMYSLLRLLRDFAHKADFTGTLLFISGLFDLS